MIDDLYARPTVLTSGLTRERAVVEIERWESSLPDDPQREVEIEPFPDRPLSVQIRRDFGPYAMRLRIFPKSLDRIFLPNSKFGFTGTLTIDRGEQSLVYFAGPEHLYTIDEVLDSLYDQFAKWFESDFLPFEAGNYSS